MRYKAPEGVTEAFLPPNYYTVENGEVETDNTADGSVLESLGFTQVDEQVAASRSEAARKAAATRAANRAAAEESGDGGGGES